MLSDTQTEILRFIAARGPSTRAALAAHLRLSQAAMSGLCKELISKGKIVEKSAAPGFGRPAKRLGLAPSGAYFIGVSMMSEPAQIGIFDFTGQLRAKTEVPRAQSPESLARAIAAKIPDLLSDAGISAENLCGIGLSLSGLVDQSQKICLKSTLLGWQDVPLGELIAQETGLPCAVENDAKSLALHAKYFGLARDYESFSLLWIGQGIGASHWANGAILRGAHGGGGEIAHATVELGGRPCRCGKTGCLDTVASLIALKEEARLLGLAADGIAPLEAAASAGHPGAIGILHRAGSALGLTIAQIIQFNDPAAVLIWHQDLQEQGLLSTVIEQTVEQNVLPRLSGQTPLTFCRIDDTTWAQAAASVAIYSYLK